MAPYWRTGSSVPAFNYFLSVSFLLAFDAYQGRAPVRQPEFLFHARAISFNTRRPKTEYFLHTGGQRIVLDERPFT
ncbi:hypothetical protein MTO96_041821 [Rhipicephalus appendiculatus]